MVLLAIYIQPSSACSTVERFFFFLFVFCFFSINQTTESFGALEDYVEISIVFQYNNC